MNSLYDESEYLEHYGIKGMKWGERRFQDENGRLTPLGKVRYGLGKLTGSAYDKDAHDFEEAAKYYSSWAETHKQYRRDEIEKRNAYEQQLYRVEKARANYAASPGATSEKLAEYDKEIARLEKIIKMYSEPGMYTSPENIAREVRSGKRMYDNARASIIESTNSPLQVAKRGEVGDVLKDSWKHGADELKDNWKVGKGVIKEKKAEVKQKVSDVAKKTVSDIANIYGESVSTGEKYISSLMSGLGKLKKKFK